MKKIKSKEILEKDINKQVNDIRQLKEDWNGKGAKSFSKKILDYTLFFTLSLDYEVKILPTGCDTIQLEYEDEREDYLEITIYDDLSLSVFYFSEIDKVTRSRKNVKHYEALNIVNSFFDEDTIGDNRCFMVMSDYTEKMMAKNIEFEKDKKTSDGEFLGKAGEKIVYTELKPCYCCGSREKIFDILRHGNRTENYFTNKEEVTIGLVSFGCVYCDRYRIEIKRDWHGKEELEVIKRELYDKWDSTIWRDRLGVCRELWRNGYEKQGDK